FHAFATRATKEHLAQLAARAVAQFVGQFSRPVRHVRLDHGRSTTLQFVPYRCDYSRMIVSDVVYAVTGEKIQDTTALRSEEFASKTTFVANIHLKQVQQSDPLRIYIFGIRSIYRRFDGARNQLRPLRN